MVELVKAIYLTVERIKGSEFLLTLITIGVIREQTAFLKASLVLLSARRYSSIQRLNHSIYKVEYCEQTYSFQLLSSTW